MIHSGALRGRIGVSKVAAMSMASLACAVLVGFSALVRIPIPGTPVPATLQTFALLACAGLLRRFFALQMVAWYLALGLLGAPFFAGGSGWSHVIGPTGGYLAGFVIAASIAGFLGGRSKRLIGECAVFLAAAMAIYVPGLAWLHLTTGASWPSTIAMGLSPFIAADIVKAVGAAACVRAAVFR